MVLAGHAGFHAVDEELVELGHGLLVENQLAGLLVLQHAAEGLVELGIVRSVGDTRIEAVPRLHQLHVDRLLGVFKNVLQGVFAGFDPGGKRINFFVAVADALQGLAPEEEGTRFRILRQT